MNYHTLPSPPHIPHNTIAREMSVLFSTVVPLNTDKPTPGVGHSNWTPHLQCWTPHLQHWGSHSIKRRTRSFPKLTDELALNYFPYPTTEPHHFPCRVSWGIHPGRLPGPARQPPGISTTSWSAPQSSWSLGLPNPDPFRLG